MNDTRRDPMKISDFGPFTLSEGSHKDPSEGMCFMEMVSFLAGEEWSDSPACASPSLSFFGQSGNDRMGQSKRDMLQLYVPKMIGTYSPEHEQARAEYLAWQAIRVFAPMALDGAGETAHAEAMRSAKTLEDAYAAANAAANAAYAAYAADAAANAAANAAHAAANAADAANAAANAAAYAANAAANAADAANAAANAAYAADAAANAANAAAYAANADAVWEKYFEALDGAIALGPSGESYAPAHLERIPALRELLTA